jgi:hypothetical protein
MRAKNEGVSRRGVMPHAEVVAAGYVVRLVYCYKIVLPGGIVNKSSFI